MLKGEKTNENKTYRNHTGSFADRTGLPFPCGGGGADGAAAGFTAESRRSEPEKRTVGKDRTVSGQFTQGRQGGEI